MFVLKTLTISEKDHPYPYHSKITKLILYRGEIWSENVKQSIIQTPICDAYFQWLNQIKLIPWLSCDFANNDFNIFIAYWKLIPPRVWRWRVIFIFTVEGIAWIPIVFNATNKSFRTLIIRTAISPFWYWHWFNAFEVGWTNQKLIAMKISGTGANKSWQLVCACPFRTSPVNTCDPVSMTINFNSVIFSTRPMFPHWAFLVSILITQIPKGSVGIGLVNLFALARWRSGSVTLTIKGKVITKMACGARFHWESVHPFHHFQSVRSIPTTSFDTRKPIATTHCESH